VRQLIRARAPRNTLHREVWCLWPYKYRSDARRLTLQRALGTVVIAEIFKRIQLHQRPP